MNAYDAFAWFYDRYWAAPLQDWQMPALNALLLNALPAGAAVLDLCCGVGHLARQLTARNFTVTGVDSSEGMLALARRNAPGAQFVLASADTFRLPVPVHAAVCTFDSINHIPEPQAVLSCFHQIRKSLIAGGSFLFDVNTPEAYGERWDASATVVEPDHAFFLRGRFDRDAWLGHTEITMFRLEEHQRGKWSRSDVALTQRPWQVEELTDLLHQAGFASVQHWRAHQDLGMEGHYGIGRVYVRAC